MFFLFVILIWLEKVVVFLLGRGVVLFSWMIVLCIVGVWLYLMRSSNFVSIV